MDHFSDILVQNQYSYTLREAKRTLSGSVVLLGIYTYLLLHLNYPLLDTFLWSVGVLMIISYRFRMILTYLPKVEAEEPLDYATLQFKAEVALTALGCAWGYIFFQTIQLAPENYDLVVLATSIGFISAAMLSAGSKFKTYLLLTSPISLAVLVALSAQQNETTPIALTITLLAYVFIYSSAFRFSQQFKENLWSFHQMKASKQDMIDTLGRASEYRDEETGEHVIRMSQSCYLMAKEIGFTEEKAVALRQASSLHDIGKIGIPDAILRKPGKLTDDEYALMKTHTDIGHNILQGSTSETIQLARIITKTHHEKWDGTGYPNQLKGVDIPIEGRITAICDVFDALTSERPYKKPWPFEKAKQYLEDNKGSHFDPRLVDVFFKILPQVITFRSAHADCLHETKSSAESSATSVTS